MSKSKIKIIDDLIVAGRPEAGGEEQSEEKALLRQAPISPRRRLRRNSCVPLAELLVGTKTLFNCRVRASQERERASAGAQEFGARADGVGGGDGHALSFCWR